jgi:septal ring factor EnvC (AmiA/AmiB activator)
MSISLDKATLEAALVGYQQQLQQIEAKMAELRRMLGKAPAAAPAAKRARKAAPAKQKHRMSAEGGLRDAPVEHAEDGEFREGFVKLGGVQRDA